MCLGIPAKIISLDENGQGEVDYLGTRVKTNLAFIENARHGDWVILHAGFAISRLDEEEAQETLAILREMVETQDR
jgi:hydrogenase expression/formation protein HypC